ncbi:hypothetical protein FNF27_04229 [Cafeteria roenbergensis]|uniref:phenylalanine--tRNA ligase n=1 Tax=Cafeteria roenbergensis TaxID=33653 RepID=A0A5A8DMZ4_CAFRO|nr:hypothetical protein FNF31_01148 [Cafeteria roenbergensis]KAA0174217.1 hypothetical protein FNF27_04229 [Cafeteria roenbergensis]
MPTLSVERDALFERLGHQYTLEDFEKLCFEFGIELDGVVEEPIDGTVASGAGASGAAAAGPVATKTVYKIDIAANRYDLLSIEGLSRALRVFLEKDPAPVYTISAPASGEHLTMTVEPSTALVRPYIVCAVLRGVTFTPASYASFIDLQDKLHQNVCRHRRLVAIGTHDLDSLTPPFRYTAQPPSEINFVPLTKTRTWGAAELLEHYETDPSVKHLKDYPQIIKDKPVYPAIYDSKDVLLSMPPIINGEHSKIKLSTRDVLIECTAVDLAKAHIVLNTMVTLFSEYASTPFSAEQVRVVYEDADQCPSAPSSLTPDLAPFEMRARVSEINETASIVVDAPTAATLASRMGLDARTDGDDAIICRVPPTRSDILHECDVIEDVAVAYGFNNIKPRLPSTPTCAAALPINMLSDKLRAALANMGFWEALTTALISRKECFEAMRLEDDDSAVTLSNPKSEAFQVVRRSLVPGLLKCIAANRALPTSLGLRFFEVSDVVLLDGESDTGARNERRLALAYAGPTAGFEVVQGAMERLMRLLEVPRRWTSKASAYAAGALVPGSTPEEVEAVMNAWGRGGFAYRVEENAHPSFFPGRCGKLVLLSNGESVPATTEIELGAFGIVHPEVLAAFEVELAGAVMEINLEPFLKQ